LVKFEIKISLYVIARTRTARRFISTELDTAKRYIWFKILVKIVDLDLYVSPSIKPICNKD
jgi:hypothetical protein